MRVERASTTALAMDVSALAPGLYYAVVRLNDGCTVQQHFIKH